ncbi:DUF1064 domain-containing protein [Planctomicrobium sp. SH661]|uniref:DUF1064 domain-containing protein n=1 Tax=Planctomicrobium sp. SH661 TaxID=3448124 RepID=UPI003F5C2F39
MTARTKKPQPTPKRTRFSILSKGLRRKRGEMNSVEAQYAALLNANENVATWWFEPFSLTLSHPTEGQPARYTPDFLVLMTDGTTYVDDVKASKGFDDKASIVRIKTAAELYPLWIFRTVYKLPKKNGGGWERHEV